MEERIELQKLPPGEQCPECGSRRWYLQDGLRYCARGHQFEGFIQFNVEEDEDAGRLGAVARREKAPREREIRQLSGAVGRSLYLEALQLLLRRQIAWFVKVQGCKEELETVVRDLWDLRIRGFNAPAPDPSLNDEAVEIFSSQPLLGGEEAGWKLRARAQSWAADRGNEWPLPILPDTLGLCYLGLVLLRAPLRLGEIISWSNHGQIPYKTAFQDLPREMQERMPSAFVRALKLPRTSPLGENLYTAVMDLVLSYNFNYTMTFPEISFMPLLIKYVKRLVLPIELVITAQKLSALLKYKFTFPKQQRRLFPADHPELRLVAVLVVATKLIVPLPGPSHQASGLTKLFTLDWDRWSKGQSELHVQSDKREVDLDLITPSQIAGMDDVDFEALVARMEVLLTTTGSSPVSDFFQCESLAIASSTVEASMEDEEESKKRARSLLQEVFTPCQDDQVAALENLRRFKHPAYQAYRTSEELSQHAAALYQAAVTAANVSLSTISRAVYTIERKLVSWQQRQRRIASKRVTSQQTKKKGMRT